MTTEEILALAHAEIDNIAEALPEVVAERMRAGKGGDRRMALIVNLTRALEAAQTTKPVSVWELATLNFAPELAKAYHLGYEQAVQDHGETGFWDVSLRKTPFDTEN